MGRMEEIIDKMAEHFCGSLCWNPHRTDITQNELDDICFECQMQKFVCDILNENERIRADKRQMPIWYSRIMGKFMEVN